MQITRSSLDTTKGPADWFTGDVFIDAIAQGHGASPLMVAAVHFTPGARTAWHAHSLGQTLCVTEGEGRVQSRGESMVTIRGVVDAGRGVALARRRARPLHVPPGRHRRRRKLGRPRVRF